MTETDAVSTHLTATRRQMQNFPLKCKLFLQLLLSTTLTSCHFQIPKNFKKNFDNFLAIFKKLNPEQKVHLISQLAQHVDSLLKGTPAPATNVINQIESSCQLKLAMMGFSYWERRNFKYNYHERTVTLFTSKKEDLLELKHYLIRHSHSNKHSLVLEAVTPDVLPKLAKLTLRFNHPSITNQIYNNLRAAILELEEKKLESYLSEDLKQKSVDSLNLSNKPNKHFTILTPKLMTDYFNSKQKDHEKLAYHKTRSQLIYHKKHIQIMRSQQNKHYYSLELKLEAPSLSQAKRKLKLLHQTAKSKAYSCQILESFAHNITANYYKIQPNDQQFQFIVIVQKNQKEDTFTQTFKGITNYSSGIYIESGLLTMTKIAKQLYSLALNLQLNFHSTKKHNQNQTAVNLLTQLVQQPHLKPFCPVNSTYCIDGKQDKTLTKPIDYSLQNVNYGNQQNFSDSKSLSAQSSQQRKDQPQEDQPEDEVFVTITNIDDEEIVSVRSFEESVAYVPPPMPPQIPVTFLAAQPFTRPLPSTPLKKLKEHFLFVDWKRSAKGGVICINEEVVNRQKKVIKLMVTRMGSSIFNGNGIMNVSLPVQLFKNQSQLVSIARNFSYAPIFVEPSVQLSALERMKKAILLEISITALSLSTQKPFNPILGQTYQGSINGCPIFMEQISHHPPISNVFMVGRGYKIYGSTRVDIHLRLNHVKGINADPLTIQYDSGDKIQFTSPIMLINGIIIGQRSIYYDGTVHLIDQKNLLITSITYNVNSKKSIFNFKNQSPDYLSGQIYQVTQPFMQKFIASGKTLSPKKDQLTKILATIHGEWNGKIFINDQLAVNFELDLPSELQDCPYCLPSDSTLRNDVKLLSKGDMASSQKEKDRLELAQRKDKKLRLERKESKNKK